jgi:hypothetical protein
MSIIKIKKFIKYKKQNIIIIFLNGQFFISYINPFFNIFNNFLNKARYDFFFEFGKDFTD